MGKSRITQIALILTFFVIIFGEETVQAFLQLRHGERPQVVDLFTRAPSQRNLRAFEDRLETQAWSAKAFRPVMQSVRFAAYGDLGEKGLAGREGWLYYRPGVNFLIEPWPLDSEQAPDTGDPLDAIVAFRDALAARGIALLVALAPGKAGVYPDRLSARVARTGTDVHGHARTFMDRLDDAGVAYVDLFAVFDAARRESQESQVLKSGTPAPVILSASEESLSKESAHRQRSFADAQDDGQGNRQVETDTPPLYLAQDTHWSPEGLRLAAEAVATRVLTEGWIEAGTTAYAERAAAVERQGDVLRMMDSLRIAAAFEPESVECSQVIEPTTGEPYVDSPDSPVLVLGDSFLRIYQHDDPGSAGFIAHLARELKQPLASIVNDGGASTLVRQELQRKPELLRGKKLVIWEFVERDLRFGMEGWQVVSLPAVDSVE